MKLTKEEIIEKISNDDVLPYIEPWALKEIVEFVIQNSKPTFSSNLDEAAEELSVEYRKRREECGLKDPIALNEVEEGNYLGVLAGAEWMAGQDQKDHELTIKDLKLLHTFLYAVKNNKQGAFTFTRLSDEQYQEVLKRFKEAKK